MDLLEHFYEHPPINERFVQRNIALPDHAHINLYGPRGCGKTAWLLQWLRHNKERTLYIDLESPALIMTPLESLPLQSFIEQYGITTLILDHYETGMMEEFPPAQQLIVSSRRPINDNRFQRIATHPLTFQDALAFHPGSPSHGFNRYLLLGTLPGTHMQPKSPLLTFKRFFQHQFTPNEQSLLLTVARLSTQALTNHQIYSFAREHFKISKDSVYRIMDGFKQENILLCLPNLIKRSGQKTFFYDFAFAKYLAVSLPFGTQFENMMINQLVHYGYHPYVLGLHEFVLDRYLVLPAPFENEDSAWEKAHKRFGHFRSFDITTVDFITVSNHFRFEIGNIIFRGVPFYEWALSPLFS